MPKEEGEQLQETDNEGELEDDEEEMNLKLMIMNLHHHQVSSLIGYMSQEYIIIHVRKYHWNNTSFIGININSRTSLCLSV